MKVKIVNKSAFDAPAYATEYSAGMDLKAILVDDFFMKMTMSINTAVEQTEPRKLIPRSLKISDVRRCILKLQHRMISPTVIIIVVIINALSADAVK